MTAAAPRLPLDPPANRSIRRGWPKSLRRIAAGSAALLACVAAVAGAGIAYEQIAGLGDAAAYPAMGALIDVGGYRLHLDCRGAGSPTIILDAGLGGSSLDWTLVQTPLSAAARVCSYDRAGMGWSDPGPAPRSPAQLAVELHALLQNGGIGGPYVLVGHSLAGKTLRLFALHYPTEVAGMVLVDARSERIDAQMSAADIAGFGSALDGQARLYTVARRLGIARLFGPALLDDEPLISPDMAREMALLATAPNAVAAATAEGLARSANDDELAVSSLGAMPLVVIAAQQSMERNAGWREAQQVLARLSSKGRLVFAKTSHAVQLEQPDIVIDAVRSVLAETSN